MKISFEGHQGLLWTDDNNVIFYGVRFNNISHAICTMLKHIRPSDSYGPWCYGNHRGIRDTTSGKIFVQEVGLIMKKLPSLYLKHVAV